MRTATIFAVCTFLQTIPALSECRPRDFLKSDITFSEKDSVFKWAYLETFSRERFEEAKRSGYLSILIPKVPLIPRLSFEDFKKIISAEASSQKQTLTEIQSEVIYQNYLSRNAVDAYIACLQDDKARLEITVPTEALTDEEFFLTLTWRGARQNLMGRFDSVGPHRFQLIGGEIPDQAEYDKLETIKDGQSIQIKIRRDLKRSFGFASSVNGVSSKVSLPPMAEPSKIRYEVAKSPDQPAYGDGLNSQHNQFCLPAKNNETFLVSTLTLLDTKQVPTNGKAWTDLHGEPGERLICATAHAELYPGKRRPGAAKIFSHIEVVRMTDPDKQP